MSGIPGWLCVCFTHENGLELLILLGFGVFTLHLFLFSVGDSTLSPMSARQIPCQLGPISSPGVVFICSKMMSYTGGIIQWCWAQPHCGVTVTSTLYEVLLPVALKPSTSWWLSPDSVHRSFMVLPSLLPTSVLRIMNIIQHLIHCAFDTGQI